MHETSCMLLQPLPSLHFLSITALHNPSQSSNQQIEAPRLASSPPPPHLHALARPGPSILYICSFSLLIIYNKNTPAMMRATAALFALVALLGLISTVRAEDPYLFFEWNVTYGTRTLLGVPQRVILINNAFPGPEINCSSNNNIVVNVFNQIDEPLLFTWNGIQHRKNSWMDGMPGTNCPILPGTNYTYKFQVKDQIGSFFYFPSLGMQKAAGGFGPIRINSRLLIPVPFADPANEISVLISDWYTKSHTVLARILDAGRSIKLPEGVLVNVKASNEPEWNQPQVVEPGLTYRYRVCNVGLKTSLNFRFQGHSMKLVEIDGAHTVQNTYDSLDVHVGQCYSVLVTMDQPAGEYLMVASTRFVKKVVIETAPFRYTNAPAGAKAPAELPQAPVGWGWSLNQWRSFRWNLTASAARPNPQGSYHYGAIPITRTIKLVNRAGTVNGKKKYALNGLSHQDADTPLKLAEYFGMADKLLTYNLIKDEAPDMDVPISVAPSVITAEFRTYIEIILQNPEKAIQSYHLDGYSFFAVGMGPGKWTPESRKTYNNLDAVSRVAIQVYPKSWTAIMLTFDNAGMWNLRSNHWDRFYLGQQLYVSVVSPAKSLRDEYNMPNSTLLCGIVKGLPITGMYS